MKKLITVVGLIITINCKGVAISGPLQNITKTIPIILEPLSVPLESSFWALIAIHGAINCLVNQLTPLENYEVGVWTYNLLEDTTISWPQMEYPTRNLMVMSSYYYDPRLKHIIWSKRTQFTSIDQFTGEETVTVTWSTTPPLVFDFNYLKVNYTRLANPAIHDNTYRYISTGKTMFYCLHTGTNKYPRPLRVTVYGLNWIPKFQGDSMRKTFLTPYEKTQWVLLGPDGMVVWSPATPTLNYNVEYNKVGESTAFYQFPSP